MNQPRQSNGEFKKRRWVPYAMAAVAISLAAYMILATKYVDNNLPHNTLDFTAQKAEAAETPEAHILANVEAAKKEVLDTLAKCESAGKKEADGITTLDTNDRGSYGPFQFQRRTVMTYVKKQTGKDISGVDAIILALKDDTARPLASYIIFNTDIGVDTDWVNCSAKYHLQEEVDLIKKLTR